MFTQIKDAIPGYRYGVQPDWLDFLLGLFNPALSVTRTMARVIERRTETADTMTVVLEPNGRWRGSVPGQHVPVRVTIDGVIHERCYSLTSEPGEQTISIMVKRRTGGRVSTYLHDHLDLGDVLELGEAGGEFILPETAGKLLLIAGGSGITPIFSLVRAALAREPNADLALLYYARTADDFALGDQLRGLAAEHPGLQLRFIAENTDGRFTPSHLVHDVADRATYLCGPSGLMQSVADHYQRVGLTRLTREMFGPAPTSTRTATTTIPVRFRRAQRTVEHTRPSLLETAEAAGLRPAYGCRLGICKTCTCTKVSGVVRDRVTGIVDDQPNRRIRICVSEPIGPVTLDL